MGPGTNPEQLFAADWSACFMGAMARAAKARGVRLPEGLAVDAEIDLVKSANGFTLAARLQVHVPGVPHDTALGRLARPRIETATPAPARHHESRKSATHATRAPDCS